MKYLNRRLVEKITHKIVKPFVGIALEWPGQGPEEGIRQHLPELDLGSGAKVHVVRFQLEPLAIHTSHFVQVQIQLSFSHFLKKTPLS